MLIPVYGLVTFTMHEVEWSTLWSLREKLTQTIHIRDYMEYLEIYRTSNFKNQYFEYYEDLISKFKEHYDNETVAIFLACHQIYNVQQTLEKLHKEYRKQENGNKLMREEIERRMAQQKRIEASKMKGL
jgi:hypothetical protein